MQKINLTSFCNNNCKYCLRDDKKSFQEPTFDAIQSVATREKNSKIFLTGGESLLKFDFYEIIKILRERKKKITLKTNGRIFFYKENAQKAVEHGIKNFVILIPSSVPDVFDDITQVKNSFYQTLQGIRNLKSLNTNIQARIIVHKKNYKELKDIFIFCKRIGVDEIFIDSLVKKGNTLKFLEELVVDPLEISDYLVRSLIFLQELDFKRVIINKVFYPLFKTNKKLKFQHDKDSDNYNLDYKQKNFQEKETHVFIQINTDCNQVCTFCNRPPTKQYKQSQHLSLKELQSKIDQIAQDWSIQRVIFTGGEPLLHKKIVQILDYAKKFGFVTEIQTNGTLLNKERLLKFKKVRLDNINFAFHSHIEKISNKLRGVSFGYNEIIKNLKLANKIGFNIHLIHVINSLNYKNLPDFIDYVNDLKINNLYLNLSMVVPEGWAWENRWVIPRMGDIKPYLIEAMKRCKQYNINFDVSEIVPLCIVNGFEEHAISTVFKIARIKISDDYCVENKILDFTNLDSDFASKAPQCKNCSLDKICAGFYPKLKELYGVDDFVPKNDDPLLILKKILPKKEKDKPFQGKEVEMANYGEERKTSQLYINLDEKCNQGCVFCVVKGSNKGKFGSMTTQEAKEIIKDFAEKEGKSIVFTGGEPTLRNDLPEIIKFIQQFQNIQSVSIITNGVRLSEKEYLKKIIKADKNKKISFCFSLHSHKEKISDLLTNTKQGFQKEISGLNNVIKTRRNISIYQVITSKNYQDLLAFSKFLNKKYPEIKDVTFAYPFPQGNALLNKWIYVEFSKLRPYLLKALRFLEKNKYTINIAACGQFPLCIIPGFEEKVLIPLLKGKEEISGVVGEKSFHEFEMASSDWIDQYKGKNKKCKECLLNFYCQGFWKEYIEMFGFDGIQSITQKNFKGKTIKIKLKKKQDFQMIKQILTGEKICLIKIEKDYNKAYATRLINFVTENKKLVIILCENKALYPL